MPIITSEDLGTHIYAEVINEITRADSSLTDKAIDAAIQEVKMYLGKYDLVQLFGTDSTDPTVHDEYLKSLVKDVACWHLLRLANATVDYSTFRTVYEDALGTLKNIMNGAVNPHGWPYYDATNESTPRGDSIHWNSNEKRVVYF